jgi:hypothetical protein
MAFVPVANVAERLNFFLVSKWSLRAAQERYEREEQEKREGEVRLS